jgi:acetate---CoA ligase (ADP-forming)
MESGAPPAMTRIDQERVRGSRRGAGEATRASLRPLFHPRSVAVVGASREPEKVGHRILRAVMAADFEGTVYPVNPHAEHVCSVRAFPSVGAIPDRVDLAVIAVPAPHVRDVVRDCGEAGVKGLVVITAGFAETGDRGRQRQEELLAEVRRHGMRMVGPNCLGLASTDPSVRLNASFSPIAPPVGRAALCSQSGALGIAVIAQARRVALGLSAFVSVGNKADVTDHHLLDYWGEDPATDVVLFYLESFGDPARLGPIARRVGRTKPVVVVKSGRTEAGERAAGSHTAALAGADTAVSAFFRQTGVIRATSLREMFDLARFLTQQPLPSGGRVGIVSNAGGPAILCADALERAGLEVPPFGERTRKALADFLPNEAATGNPVDMIASAGPDDYRRAMELVLGSGEVDSVVAMYTPVALFQMEAIERAIVDSVESARVGGDRMVPVLASMVGGDEDIYVLRGERESIPAYPFPEEIAHVLGRSVAYRRWRETEPGKHVEFDDQRLADARAICRGVVEELGEGWLPAMEARRVLEAAGLRVPPGGVADTAERAVELADEIGYPVAMKLASRTLIHKTEIGGVRLGLEDEDQVRAAFRAIRERVEQEGALDSMEGVLMQPMLDETAEVMLGVDPDPVFGPVLAFGLGGIHVEVLEDLAFRVAPLTDRDAREMVREIRGYRLLTGYRAHPEADVEALEEALLRLSRLVEQVPEISQVDLNPVFALEPGEGYCIVDARIEVVAA